MKHFLLFLLKAGLVFLMMGFTLEVVLHLQMRDKRAHVLEDWEDLRGLNDEVWFIGDSRTSTHVQPLELEKQCGKSIYNLGYDGFRVKMGKERVEYALTHARTKPKYVVLQVDNSYIAQRRVQNNFPMKDGVLRYFFLDPLEINRHFKHYENWRQSDSFIPLLRYKGYPLMFTKHLLGWNRWDKRKQKGFWNNVGATSAPPTAQEEAPPKQLVLLGIDSLLDAHGIELIGFIPPSRKGFDTPPTSLLDSLMGNRNVWDFSLLLDSAESNVFRDSRHFSMEGVSIFTSHLAAELRELD